MGTLDRGLRTAAALLVAVLYVAEQIGGGTAAVLGAFAAIFLPTSAVGTCPLYLSFGFPTCRQKEAAL